MKDLEILSWNVNGIRALYRDELWNPLLEMGMDVVCLQETKAEKEQLPDDVQNPKGYSAFFHSSKERRGYSGTAILSKQEPEKVVYGFPQKNYEHLDRQGRLMAIYIEDTVVVNCYFPNGGRNQEKLDYKLEFYDAFLEYMNDLRNEGLRVIWCGDVNVAHEEIDIARPKENEGRTGFLPEERAWVDEVLAQGWVDVFRMVYPNRKDSYTYWDTITRARDRNVGWRIDYFFVDQSDAQKVKSIEHKTDMYGSDHCPVVMRLGK